MSAFKKWFDGQPSLKRYSSSIIEDDMRLCWNAALANAAKVINREAHDVVLDRDTVLHLLAAIEKEKV